MTSRSAADMEAYVWIWLPGQVQPVVAGRLYQDDGLLRFNYGRSYLGRDDAIPLYLPELPLRAGEHDLLPGLTLPNCIRDGAPDAWGRRVIINRLVGSGGGHIDTNQFDELTYLLESGSDRSGALDFQSSPDAYVPRTASSAPLETLLRAAEMVEMGIPLPPDLDAAMNHGTSIGGARPKALITTDDRKFVAKFSSATDIHSVVKAEFIAMRLAGLAGLDAAPVELQRASGNDVLLIERFDRVRAANGWQRRCMVSALTLFGLNEMLARYASYEQLAEIVRHRFTDVPATLRELFGRMTFNVLVGNTDDHARNHAAFWDGDQLTLPPAYDICPQGRTGGEASQAMTLHDNDNRSRIASCLAAAHHFLLSREQATGIVEEQVECIGANWVSVCAAADLGEVDRAFLWGRQFLNSYAFEDLGPGSSHLQALADAIRDRGGR